MSSGTSVAEPWVDGGMDGGPTGEVVLPPCPTCGGKLRLEFRFKVKVVSLAGASMKLGATEWPYLVCDCGFTEEGRVE